MHTALNMLLSSHIQFNLIRDKIIEEMVIWDSTALVLCNVMLELVSK